LVFDDKTRTAHDEKGTNRKRGPRARERSPVGHDRRGFVAAAREKLVAIEVQETFYGPETAALDRPVAVTTD